MSTETVTEARNKAGNYFKEGYNCAEAIFLTFREILAPEMDPATVKMMTGFGGGVGQAGCMCGALAGAIASLNMVAGRKTIKESREESYSLSKEFHDRFVDHYGVTCCRALNSHEFESREHLVTCLKITGNTGKMLMEFIEEKKLLGC